MNAVCWIDSWHAAFGWILLASLYMGALAAIVRLLAHASPARDRDRLESAERNQPSGHLPGKIDRDACTPMVDALDNPLSPPDDG